MNVFYMVGGVIVLILFLIIIDGFRHIGKGADGDGQAELDERVKAEERRKRQGK